MKMTKYSKVTIFIFNLIVIALFFSCKKNKLASVETTVVTKITCTTFTGGGNVTDDNGKIIISKGLCWSVYPDPIAVGLCTNEGSGSGYFQSTAKSLMPGTTYYVRAYVTSEAGTNYGNTLEVTTMTNEVQFNSQLTYGTLTDIDGNIYRTIVIGSQTWMAENLKVGHYRNGDSIPNITNDNSWLSLTSGACCLQTNPPPSTIYNGTYYNWYAVNDSRGLAPVGWHIPSTNEWIALANSLGGLDFAGSKLMEESDRHWVYLRQATCFGTNQSGYTALPTGYRSNAGGFAVANIAFWWSTDWVDIYNAYKVEISPSWYEDRIPLRVSLYSNKNLGCNIRCVKD